MSDKKWKKSSINIKVINKEIDKSIKCNAMINSVIDEYKLNLHQLHSDIAIVLHDLFAKQKGYFTKKVIEESTLESDLDTIIKPFTKANFNIQEAEAYKSDFTSALQAYYLNEQIPSYVKEQTTYFSTDVEHDKLMFHANGLDKDYFKNFNNFLVESKGVRYPNLKQIKNSGFPLSLGFDLKLEFFANREFVELVLKTFTETKTNEEFKDALEVLLSLPKDRYQKTMEEIMKHPDAESFKSANTIMNVDKENLDVLMHSVHIQNFHNQYEKVLLLDTINQQETENSDNSLTNTADNQLYKSKALNTIKTWFGDLSYGFLQQFDSNRSNQQEKEKLQPEQKEGFGITDTLVSLIHGYNKQGVEDQKSNALTTPSTPASSEISTDNIVAKLTATQINIDDADIINKLHKSFQYAAGAMIDIAKAACYGEAIKMQLKLSSCLIEVSQDSLETMDKTKCNALATQVQIGLKNCDTAFPMATENDSKINEYLSQSINVETELTDSGASLVSNHHIELFQLVYESYGLQ